MGVRASCCPIVLDQNVGVEEHLMAPPFRRVRKTGLARRAHAGMVCDQRLRQQEIDQIALIVDTRLNTAPSVANTSVARIESLR